MDRTEILQKLSAQELTVEEAERLLQADSSDELGYAKIDYQREERTGVPEVIYCEGKTAQQVAGIVKNMREHGAEHILGTRCSEEKYLAAAAVCPGLQYDQTARTIVYDPIPVPLNK